MNEKLKETLTITQEEAAEVIQSVSKVFRFGLDNSHKSGKTQRENLTQELGDFLAMVDLLVEQGVVTTEDLDRAKQAKIEKLRIWSNILND